MEKSVLPSYAALCCDTLRKAGHQANPVGGCVRDLLLDWPEDNVREKLLVLLK